MTTTLTAPTVTARPRLWSRGFVFAVLAGCGSSVSFYLLFAAVPLYASSIGAGGVGAGLTTGVMMLATVAAELATPWLLSRYGYRLMFGTGLLLLGLPALALSVSGGMIAILAACVVRGLGFAVVAVLGSALVAGAAPPERRGEALGVYGLVCGIPSMAALPLGVWLAETAGFVPVFVAGGVAALIGLVAVRGLPGGRPDPVRSVGMPAALRMGALVRPSIMFAATTVAAGVVTTFLPLTFADAALALLVQSATTTLTRWWAGRHGDRHGPGRLLVPGLLLTAAGMLTLVLSPAPAAVLAGMVLLGAGFGIAQNASIAVMLARVQPSSYGAVSALWNIAYDAGLGVGAMAFGLVALQTGYPAAFGLTGLLVLIAITARSDKKEV